MKKYFYLTFVLFVIVDVYLNEIRLTDNENGYYFWANLLYWLNAIPILNFFLVGYKKEIFPFMGLVGLFIISSYAIPIFIINSNSYQLGKLSVESLKWAFYAYSIFYLVYYLFKDSPVFQINFFDPIKINLDSPKVKQLAYFFLSFWVLNKLDLSYSSLYHVSIIGIYIYC